MYTINARGARTLADATPLVYGGQKVYVTTEGHTAQLHLGGHIVADRPAAEIRSARDAQDWAYETIDAAEQLVAWANDPANADADAVAEALGL